MAHEQWAREQTLYVFIFEGQFCVLSSFVNFFFTELQALEGASAALINKKKEATLQVLILIDEPLHISFCTLPG